MGGFLSSSLGNPRTEDGFSKYPHLYFGEGFVYNGRRYFTADMRWISTMYERNESESDYGLYNLDGDPNLKGGPEVAPYVHSSQLMDLVACVDKATMKVEKLEDETFSFSFTYSSRSDCRISLFFLSAIEKFSSLVPGEIPAYFSGMLPAGYSRKFEISGGDFPNLDDFNPADLRFSLKRSMKAPLVIVIGEFTEFGAISSMEKDGSLTSDLYSVNDVYKDGDRYVGIVSFSKSRTGDYSCKADHEIIQVAGHLYLLHELYAVGAGDTTDAVDTNVGETLPGTGSDEEPVPTIVEIPAHESFDGGDALTTTTTTSTTTTSTAADKAAAASGTVVEYESIPLESDSDSAGFGVFNRSKEGSATPKRERLFQDCVVCLSAKADVISWPCRHVCLCEQCAAVVVASTRNCPICRAEMQSIIRISHDQIK